jgi:hypothetical protein
MAESTKKGSMVQVERSTSVSPIQEFQFGKYDPGKGEEPGVRLRFTNAAGGYNHVSSQTLTLGQLAGLVEVAAPDIPHELRMRMIAVLAGARFDAPHPMVVADAQRWVE